MVVKEKLPTQVINLLTQPRFEPGIFLVKIQTSPVHHRAQLYSSVSEDNCVLFYLESVSITGGIGNGSNNTMGARLEMLNKTTKYLSQDSLSGFSKFNQSQESWRFIKKQWIFRRRLIRQR
jgi:hypothetical protein